MKKVVGLLVVSILAASPVFARKNVNGVEVQPKSASWPIQLTPP